MRGITTRKKRGFGRVARIHFASSLGIFSVYLLLSLVYSPEFLLQDVRDRFRAFADETIAVTGRVLAPPSRPVVSGEGTCVNGILSVGLEWADDESTESFDVSRDGIPLVSGLSASHYDDMNVLPGSSYAYVVTAFGPMGPGSAVSDPITVVTPAACDTPIPEPTVEIVSFDGKPVAYFAGTPKTDARRPVFTGTTNIPNARISTVIGSSTIISAEISANGNGYFSWRPPVGVDVGPRTLLLVATDPSDPSRSASTFFRFVIRRPEADSDPDERDVSGVTGQVGDDVLPPDSGSCPESTTVVCAVDADVLDIPLRFTLHTDGSDVVQGQSATAIVRVLFLDPSLEGVDAVIRYVLLDGEGRKQASFLGEAVLTSGGSIRQEVPIPGHVRTGAHVLRAEVLLGRHSMARETEIRIVPFPFLDFGGGFAVSYPDFLRHLGTVAWWLILLLFLWSFLFLREYGLFLKAARHITERNLSRAGFFGLGKGISKK